MDMPSPLPLAGESEELCLTAEAGTWISVDVSPDGRTLLFDLIGTLYEMPIRGGNPEALTPGMAFDAQPRFSPDGNWIAFISDRSGADNLWLMDRSSHELRQLSDNEQSIAISPSWVPGMQEILVAECLSYLSEATLRRYPVDGGDPVDVVDERSHPVKGSGGVLSPDGTYLYFSHRDPSDELRYLMPVAQIRRVHLPTGRVQSLTEGRGGGTRPVVSPDGRLLAYASRHEGRTGLRIRDLQSGDDRLLSWPIQQDRQDYGRALRGDQIPNYAFTSDGHDIVLAHGGQIHRLNILDGSSTVVPFRVDARLHVAVRQHHPRRVDQGPVTARVVHMPAWSPDGDSVAVSALGKLWVVDTGSSAEPRRLTGDDHVEIQPAWSPDGEQIAYVVWSGSQRGHIWSAPSRGTGSALRLTTTPGFYTDLAFSSDGERILAMRGIDTRPGTPPEDLPATLDLVWLPAGGGDVHLIQPAHPGRHPHTVTGDPERIYTTNGHALFSIGPDGTGSRTHLTVVGRFSAEENTQPVAEQIKVGPDASRVLALINKQLWCIRLPHGESGPQTVDVRDPGVDGICLTEVGADYFGWIDEATIFWAIGSTVYRSSLDGSSPTPLERSPATRAIPVVVTADRAVPQGVTILRGARVIPMDRGGVALRPAPYDITVSTNRIVAIAPTGQLPEPEGARVVDVSGCHVVPGFVDTHAHWTYPPPEVTELDNWSLRANLAYGVTTGLDVQSNDVANFVYQDLVETGQTVGPRAFMVGPGIFGVNNYKPYEANFDSYASAVNYLRRYQQHYRVHVVKAYLSGNRRQRQWLAMACRELGLMATTEGFGDPVLHLTHAMDGMHGNEHAMTDTELFQDVVELLAHTRTSHTSTLSITHYGIPGFEYFLSRFDLQDDEKVNRFYPREVLLDLTSRRRIWGRSNEFGISVMAAQAAKMQRAGGLVGVGSHGEIQGLGYHWEMQMLAMGGMSPLEILTAATRDGAEILGLEADLGSLEVGKLADLVLLAADPLDDIRNTTAIVYVMKNGVLLDGNTLDQV